MNTSNLSRYIRKNGQYIIFIVVALTIPLTKRYLPYAMVLWVVSWLVSIRKIDIKNFNSIIIVLFPVVFYIIHLIGLAYSTNLEKGIMGLQVKLSLLAIPLVAVFMTDKAANNFKIILKVFIWANFAASIICLIFAFSNSIHLGEQGISFESSVWPEGLVGYTPLKLIASRYSYFSYNYLSIFHHPSYFSVYVLFSIFSLIYLIRDEKNRLLGYYFLIFYFTIFILLLGSRAAFISYIFGLIVFVFVLILKFKKYWIGLSLLVLITIFSTIILSNEHVKKNISESATLIKNGKLNEDSDIRFWTWKAGFEVFKENLWFGVGTGDIKQELQKKYEKYGLTRAKEQNYNAHSQYLDIAIKFGVIGLVFVISWLSYILYLSIKKKQFLYFYFILIMIINFVFEVMLNSIAGVSFFAFFYSLLYVKYNRA